MSSDLQNSPSRPAYNGQLSPGVGRLIHPTDRRPTHSLGNLIAALLRRTVCVESGKEHLIF